jgi:hypothetical protein
VGPLKPIEIKILIFISIGNKINLSISSEHRASDGSRQPVR